MHSTADKSWQAYNVANLVVLFCPISCFDNEIKFQKGLVPVHGSKMIWGVVYENRLIFCYRSENVRMLAVIYILAQITIHLLLCSSE